MHPLGTGRASLAIAKHTFRTTDVSVYITDAWRRAKLEPSATRHVPRLQL
jgi:hypothetical protein